MINRYQRCMTCPRRLYPLVDSPLFLVHQPSSQLHIYLYVYASSFVYKRLYHLSWSFFSHIYINIIYLLTLYILPINKIYIDTRHSTADSKSTSDCKQIPSNKTLPYNTAFYITDITVPVSGYTVEAYKN